ncbi:MAG: Zn-dependent hydrolase of the beta-lactamase fold-like protein [Parcubacteria group bacterium GW2011_GWF2_39_13b]|nr:MAG: Zn-dependent hydrolase of the beta-lactamase fold-like protein [Parcubacteria group bacterium GW2011_GWF2_39_13b]
MARGDDWDIIKIRKKNFLTVYGLLTTDYGKIFAVSGRRWAVVAEMIITWYGHSCFKIITNSLTIIIDPFNKDIGLRPPQGQADIVLVSHDHHDHNNISAINGSPFVIKGPGEYEVKGISIVGVESAHDIKKGEERGLNTIYLIESEDIKLCHFGDFGQDDLTDEQTEAINEPDIIFVPVGGKYTIGATRATTMMNSLEPKIVIPMHYKMPGVKSDIDSVDRFLKEMGAGKKSAVDKLAIKKKTLPEQMEVVVMKL